GGKPPSEQRWVTERKRPETRPPGPPESPVPDAAGPFSCAGSPAAGRCKSSIPMLTIQTGRRKPAPPARRASRDPPTMSQDISRILGDWPHEPGKLNVRIVEDAEGEMWIQVRLDLGLLQMRLDGRPDGQRPNGCESYLEYFEQLVDELEAEDPAAFEDE